MDLKIKITHSTIIKDKEIWQEIVLEAMKKPFPSVIKRNKKSLELLKHMKENE